jgi:hypothetical protein
MDHAELSRALDEVKKLAADTRLECMVLQTVCAGLMAEVAALSEDPRSTLDRMVASLHGLAFGMGQSGGQPHLTRTVERICQLAEDSLQAPG